MRSAALVISCVLMSVSPLLGQDDSRGEQPEYTADDLEQIAMTLRGLAGKMFTHGSRSVDGDLAYNTADLVYDLAQEVAQLAFGYQLLNRVECDKSLAWGSYGRRASRNAWNILAILGTIRVQGERASTQGFGDIVAEVHSVVAEVADLLPKPPDWD